MALAVHRPESFGGVNFEAEKKGKTWSGPYGDEADHQRAIFSLGTVLPLRLPKILSTLLAIILTLSYFGGAEFSCSAIPLSCSTLGPNVVSTNVTANLTEVLQVYPPVLTVNDEEELSVTDGSPDRTVAVGPAKGPFCEQTLLTHSFGSSYGQPYVGEHTPPPCDFNRVTWNLTVTSAGRQFDRLGSISLGDVELFRTSTAEPTKGGIIWTYLKDMTHYRSILETQQTIIFDLGNLINEIYTAPFNVTLSATYFTVEDNGDPADLILPVSKRLGSAGQPSYFKTPDERAISNLTLPRNVRRAVFTIAATGQALEEFWWSNALQSQVDTFPGVGTLPGHSPFREVQLYIDGLLAGVIWPYPIIFTGGVVPGLWRPLVGIDAFDLKEDEIDITPWLPMLCDGFSHVFEIRVAGLNDANGSVEFGNATDTSWWVSGKVFLWLDIPGSITKGGAVQLQDPLPTLKISSHLLKNSNGTNETLIYSVNAQRHLSISSTVHTSTGETKAYWKQDLSFTNDENFTAMGNVTTSYQRTVGRDQSSSGYARSLDYPLYSYSTQGYDRDNLTLTAVIRRGKFVKTFGESVLPTGLEAYNQSWQGAALSTTQNGKAYYSANQTEHTSFSFGTTDQNMTLSGFSTESASDHQQSLPEITQFQELFHRYVLASNGSVLRDDETLIGKSVGQHYQVSGPPDDSGTVFSGMPARGPMLQWQQSAEA